MRNADARLLRRIPERYDRFLGALFFEPYARALAKKLPSDARCILDLACGSGILSRALQVQSNSMNIVGADKSASMIRFAARSSVSMRFVRGDAGLLPFRDNIFDAVTCGFGLMFFSDLPSAIAEVRRVLKPGATFLASIWDNLEMNEAANLTNEVARSFFETHQPPFFETPYAMRAKVVCEALSNAGFNRVCTEQDCLANDQISSADAAVGLLAGNPILSRILECDDHLLQPMIDSVADALSARFGDPVTASMSASILTAHSPVLRSMPQSTQ